MPRSFQENLRLFATLSVREGVAIQPGQELILTSAVEQAPFVRLLAEEAYRAGAKNVAVIWSDSELALARFRHGTDEAIGYAPGWLYDGITRAFSENAARLSVTSEDPSMLASIPPEQVAVNSRATSMAAKAMFEYIGAFKINWCIVGAASKAWAERVFPGIPSEEAVAKLWDAIFLTSRVLEDDPIAAWSAHCDRLRERMDYLNSLKMSALHFQGPGTDLKVGLVDDHVWIGGRGDSQNGVTCSPNIPTEEVFTMPHRMRVDGTVSSTKPLSLRGHLVDGIQVEFKDGAVVRATAKQGEETLTRLIGTDDGSKRLGEVALVPNSAKVAQSGVLFLNTLYDENGASHIALGAALGENMKGYENLTEEERLERGANDSLTHVDWMIGSGEVDVDAILRDGSSKPLMRSGEWV